MKYMILSMGSRVCGSMRGPFFTRHPPNLIGLGPIVFLIKIYCVKHLSFLSQLCIAGVNHVIHVYIALLMLEVVKPIFSALHGHLSLLSIFYIFCSKCLHNCPDGYILYDHT